MRTWKLTADDPRHLTLAADARITPTDYVNDIIWEINPGLGEPPALAIQTTFGLRARLMQFFPSFTRLGKTRTDPASFHQPPVVTRCYPNYISLTCEPFDGVNLTAEYHVPVSSALAGRFTFHNRSILPHNIRLEWSGLLSPLSGGEGMVAQTLEYSTVLQGRTAELAVIGFFSGGPAAAKGPYPGLTTQLELYPGATQTFQWSVAAMPSTAEAMELARAITSRPWEAEIARCELLNAAETVEFETGRADWDATLTLAQKAAFSLWHTSTQALPAPSIVLSRRIDQGAAAREDGSDYPYLWSGQPVQEAAYLAGQLLPGAPQHGLNLLDNYLHTQDDSGFIDWKPGLGGQLTRQLAPPMLTSLIEPTQVNPEWLTARWPALLRFARLWLSPLHDRDQDGLPEWDHPLQTGLDTLPLFDRWNPSAQGVEISTVESPALAAMLHRECANLLALGRAAHLEEDFADDMAWLEETLTRLREAVEETWDSQAHLYRYRDAATHRSLSGRTLFEFSGAGDFAIHKRLRSAQRLVLHIDAVGEGTRAVIVRLAGLDTKNRPVEETLLPRSFTWSRRRGVVTSRQVYSRVERIEIEGLSDEDRGRLRSVDLSQTDLSLFLPLWASIPSSERAIELIEQTLLPQFLSPAGFTTCAGESCLGGPPELTYIGLPWNAWIIEGMLRYGYRKEAAQVFTCLMDAAALALKNERTFYQYYEAKTGQVRGERGHLAGISPAGLFLRLIGIDRLTPDEIWVRDSCPFPWTVTVKYRTIVLTRKGDQTTITLPGVTPLSLTGPGPHQISLT